VVFQERCDALLFLFTMTAEGKSATKNEAAQGLSVPFGLRRPTHGLIVNRTASSMKKGHPRSNFDLDWPHRKNAMHRQRLPYLALVLSLALAACAGGVGTQTPTADSTAARLTAEAEAATATPTLTPTLTPTPTPVVLDADVSGFSYRCSTAGYLSAEGSDWTLRQRMQPIGAKWIRLDVSSGCFQEDVTASEISCPANGDAPSESDLEHVAALAHSLGMKVMLEPQLDLPERAYFRLEDIGLFFDEAQWATWFESYDEFVLRYAALAEQIGVDLFSIGEDLEYAATRERDWRALVEAVRQEYSGPILYSAGGTESWLGISWWDAVDAIGVHANGIRLADNEDASVEDMLAYWAPVVENLRELSATWDRPVVITELGYASVDGFATEPWNADHIGGVDLQEQAKLYQAALQAFAGQEWMRGIFWSGWECLGTLAGLQNIGLAFNDKPAEDVLRTHYGAPARPTPEAPPILNSAVGLDIYREGLNQGWETALSGEGSQIDLNQKPVSIGQFGIEVTLGPQGTLTFTDVEGRDLSAYAWLELFFYSRETLVWGEDAALAGYRPFRLYVSLVGEDGMPRPFRVDALHSEYLVEGKLLPLRWLRIRIPLAAFGPSSEPFSGVMVENASPFEIPAFYLDSIRLWGGR
jgi:hypothetical protein